MEHELRNCPLPELGEGWRVDEHGNVHGPTRIVKMEPRNAILNLIQQLRTRPMPNPGLREELEGLYEYAKGWVERMEPGEQREINRIYQNMIRAILDAHKEYPQQSGVWIDDPSGGIPVLRKASGSKLICPGGMRVCTNCQRQQGHEDPDTCPYCGAIRFTSLAEDVAIYLAPQEQPKPQWKVTQLASVTVKVWRAIEDGSLCCSECLGDAPDCPYCGAVADFTNGDGPWLVEPTDNKETGQ